MLITILHANIGSEVGAHFVEEFNNLLFQKYRKCSIFFVQDFIRETKIDLLDKSLIVNFELRLLYPYGSNKQSTFKHYAAQWASRDRTKILFC